jgi:hypothetical protein
MFHAPIIEAKPPNNVSRNQVMPQPRRELSPFVSAAGPAWLGAASGPTPLRLHSGGPRQELARLHSVYGNQAVLRTLSGAPSGFQAKLAVNQPGDQYEQEADRVADQVMRMTSPVQRNSSACQAEDQVQRKCAECEEEEKKTGLQRKEAGAGPEFAPPSLHAVLSSPGHPLDPATRAFMEPRFGYDFGQVRVHDDQRASDSARDVHAQAYTVGSHIVFGRQQYAPETAEGRRLLAHELTHTVQQARIRPPSSTLSGAVFEEEQPADSIATSTRSWPSLATVFNHLPPPGRREQPQAGNLSAADEASANGVVVAEPLATLPKSVQRKDEKAAGGAECESLKIFTELDPGAFVSNAYFEDGNYVDKSKFKADLASSQKGACDVRSDFSDITLSWDLGNKNLGSKMTVNINKDSHSIDLNNHLIYKGAKCCSCFQGSASWSFDIAAERTFDKGKKTERKETGKTKSPITGSKKTKDCKGDACCSISKDVDVNYGLGDDEISVTLSGKISLVGTMHPKKA